MEKRDREILETVLEKRRGCVPLTQEEQAWVDSTFNRLFEKKFGNRTFVSRTGDDIRKDAHPDKSVGAQKEKPISKDVPFAGSQKIESDDPSGKVKETEEGENVDVDEKDEGGEAEHVNASDITHADNDDLQRKPVIKFEAGDVVVKTIDGKPYAGVIVKYYPDHKAAMVKWSNRTFSTVHISTLEKVADKFREESEKVNPPIAKPADEKSKSGLPSETVTEAAKVKKGEKWESCVEQVSESSDVESPEAVCTESLGGTEKVSKEGEVPEEEEAPWDEEKETPEQQAEEASSGVEAHEVPSDTEMPENEWENKVKAMVLKNSNVEDAGAIVSYFKDNLSKAEGGKVSMPVDEVCKGPNKKLCAFMQKSGYKAINLASKAGSPITFGKKK